MKKKRIIVPARYIRIERTKGTVALRRKDGTLKGRKAVQGYGDSTYTRRVTKDLDIDKDGSIDVFGGTIFGRSKPVKASKRSRGYVRQI